MRLRERLRECRLAVYWSVGAKEAYSKLREESAMRVRDLSGTVRTARLSRNSASSSYGQAVLMVDGEAHGWFDVAGWSIVQASKKEREGLKSAGFFMQDEQEEG
jgi:hypothetical protein